MSEEEREVFLCSRVNMQVLLIPQMLRRSIQDGKRALSLLQRRAVSTGILTRALRSRLPRLMTHVVVNASSSLSVSGILEVSGFHC